MIYSKLHPDILYQGRKYSIFDENRSDNILPIVQLYNDWDGSPILLLGDGSMGKSTAMRVLEAELLFRGIHVILIECGSITKRTNFASLLSQSRPNTVFLIDGLDEINNTYEKALFGFLENITGKYKVIVSSRYNPVKGKLHNDELDEYETRKHKLAERFAHATLCPFTPDEISQIVGDYIDRDSKCFALLSNTMFMAIVHSLYEGHKKEQVSKFNLAEDEISLIQTYFDILFEEKERSKKADIYLRDIGHAKYKTLLGTPITEPVDIPDELKGIFKLIKSKSSNYRVKTTQQSYENFAMAKYLLSRVEEEFYLDLNLNTLEHLFKYSNLNHGALVYLGNMISKHKDGAEIMRKLNAFPKSDTRCYMNLVFIFLGYRYGVMDDFAINGVFDIGPKFVEIAAKQDFFSFNKYLKEINSVRLVDLSKLGICFETSFNVVIPDSVTRLKPKAFLPVSECIKDITVGKSLCKIGAWAFSSDRPKIRNLYVHPQNRFFEIRGNCLINKKNNTLVLCGAEANIPEDIIRIESQALYSLTPLIIPRTITNIGNQDGYIGLKVDGSRFFISMNPTLEVDEHSSQLDYFYGNSVQELLLDEISASSYKTRITTLLERKYSFSEHDYSDDSIELLSDAPYYLTKEYEKFLRLNGGCEQIQQESSSTDSHNLFNCINFNDTTKNIYTYYSVGFSEMKSVAGAVFKSMRNGFSEDLFLLVNGFPLVYIKAVDSQKDLTTAYSGLNAFYQTHEEEFKYTQFCIITNGTETKIGRASDPFERFVDYSIDEKKYIPSYLNICSGLSTIGIAVHNLFEPSKLLDAIHMILSGQALRKVIRTNLSSLDGEYIQERTNDETRAKVYSLEGDAQDLKSGVKSIDDDMIKKQSKIIAGAVVGVFVAMVIAFVVLNFKKIVLYAHFNMGKYWLYSMLFLVAFMVVTIVLWTVLMIGITSFRMNRWTNGKGTMMMGKIPRIQTLFEIQDYLFKRGYYTYIALDC